MRKIYFLALHLLLLAIMPTTLLGCTKCNVGNKVSEQMKDIKQKELPAR